MYLGVKENMCTQLLWVVIQHMSKIWRCIQLLWVLILPGPSLAKLKRRHMDLQSLAAARPSLSRQVLAPCTSRAWPSPAKLELGGACC